MRTRRPQSSSDPVASVHRSVLLHESLEGLTLKPSASVVDATLGGAGHSAAIAGVLGKEGVLIGFDADSAAIARAEERLQDATCAVHLAQRNFRHMKEELADLGITTVDAVLIDLGWSSFQLAAGRGFSFQTDEPLLMTYDADPTEEQTTAREIVNEWAEESIADIIYGWGEERYARRIAKAIIEARVEAPIETALQLAEIVSEAVPSRERYKRTHPATKTFQALRIAVNDEMGALQDALSAVKEMAHSGTRVAIISFHSIEDRLVKQTFRDWMKDGVGTVVNKKPITPGEEELSENPRARSAKLRIFEF